MFNSISDRFGSYTRKLAIIVSVIALVIFAWANLFYNVSMNANAATLEGVGNQVEGKVQKDIGTTRRAIGDILDNPGEEARGALGQAKGQTKQTMGTAKNKLDDAQNTIEDKSESIIDSVKDLFE